MPTQTSPEFPSQLDSFDLDQINDRLRIALERLINHDGVLIRENANERSICARLAFYIQQEFPEFHVDCEYNRHHNDPQHIKRLHDSNLLQIVREKRKDDDIDSVSVFPDIIVHRRGTNENLLVIEAKKTTSDVNFEAFDLAKLKTYKSELKFRFAKFLCFGTRTNEEPITQNRDI